MMLYAVGSRALWNLISSSTSIARHSPSSGHYRAVIGFNPFPLLAMLPLLHTVILHRVWNPLGPEESDGKSPFECLPPTLQHLEYEETATFRTLGLGVGSSHPKLVDEDIGWYANMDFGLAFPELKRLRLCWRKQTGAHPRWVKTLPSTLESLSLCHIGFEEEILFYICGAETALDIHPMLLKIPVARRSPVLPIDRAARPLPFPSLNAIELLSVRNPLPFGLNELPFSVKHLRWRPRRALNAQPSSMPNSQPTSKGLSSLHVWLSADLSKLTSDLHATDLTLCQVNDPDALNLTSQLKSLNIDFQEGYPRYAGLISTLFSLEAQLHTLIIHRASIDSSYEAKKQLAVLSTLTRLELPHLHKTGFGLLPPGLLTLKVGHDLMDPTHIVLDDEGIAQLPKGLTELTWINLGIELGHIPTLPRSLIHLTFKPLHRSKIGKTFITPDILVEPNRRGIAHLYESITGSTCVLFGLPPHLETLRLKGALPVFDSNFGLFLPRHLRAIHGDGENNYCIDIAAGPSKPTGFGRIASLFGILSQESDQLRLQAAITAFPPGCVSTLYFCKSGGMGSAKHIPITSLSNITNTTHMEPF